MRPENKNHEQDKLATEFTNPGQYKPCKRKRDYVLITGASSGIGLELARIFAGEGNNLVLVARDQSKLDSLAQEIQLAHEVQATVIVQDLADPYGPRAIAAELASQSIEIDILVNNAGTQVYGEFTERMLEQQLALIQVNTVALIHLTHLLLPGMIQRRYGKILNVGSTGAFAPGPLNAVYCATKAFVTRFSQAVGAELAGSGVTVTALCPGATNTPFIARHGMQDVRIFRHTMSPARVARIGYRALQRRRPLVTAGFSNQLQVFCFQIMAPFLGILPPAWLKAVGSLFMGRASSDKQKLHPAQR